VLKQKLELKALVTGASGFIGGRLRDALLDAGADVVAIVRPSSPEPKRGRSAVAAYDDKKALAQIMREEKPDLVFHVAGATKGVSYEDFQRANVMPTVNLVEALKQEHPEVSRFVMVSSLTSFGPSKPGTPHTESSPRRPIEHYGKSKLEAEERLEAETDGLRWTILRPGGVYGPGDGDYFNLFREINSGRNVFFGNKKRLFSAIYVDDCVRACVDCTQTDTSLSRGYFICDGEPITWEQFQQKIIDAADRRVRTLNLPEFLVGIAAMGGELATKVDKKPRLFNRQKAKMGAQEAWTCVHDAARDDFGYKPQVRVGEGVKRAFAWYREHGWL
jgi:nucleoside-diphosphate-sugar epimerase